MHPYPDDDTPEPGCLWCEEPADTDICPACQARYEEATAPPQASLVEIVRAVTRRKKLGRV